MSDLLAFEMSKQAICAWRKITSNAKRQLRHTANHIIYHNENRKLKHTARQFYLAILLIFLHCSGAAVPVMRGNSTKGVIMNSSNRVRFIIQQGVTSLFANSICCLPKMLSILHEKNCDRYMPHNTRPRCNISLCVINDILFTVRAHIPNLHRYSCCCDALLYLKVMFTTAEFLTYLLVIPTRQN